MTPERIISCTFVVLNMTFAMKKTIYIVALLFGVGLLCSCENSVEQPAKDVLAVVQSEYEAGNYNKAKQYLDKAEDTKEKVYTTGLYYMAIGEYDKAQEYLNRAKNSGITEAEEMLAQCTKLKAYYAKNK